MNDKLCLKFPDLPGPECSGLMILSQHPVEEFAYIPYSVRGNLAITLYPDSGWAAEKKLFLFHRKLCLLLGSGHYSVGRAGPRPQGPRRCQDQVGLVLGRARISERAISRMSHIRPLKVEWHLD